MANEPRELPRNKVQNVGASSGLFSAFLVKSHLQACMPLTLKSRIVLITSRIHANLEFWSTRMVPWMCTPGPWRGGSSNSEAQVDFASGSRLMHVHFFEYVLPFPVSGLGLELYMILVERDRSTRTAISFDQNIE